MRKNNPCKVCIASKFKLYLKGEHEGSKCFSQKCPLTKRHSIDSINNISVIRNKFNFMQFYGINYNSLKTYAKYHMKENPDGIIYILERRLDVIVYRAGWAKSIFEAKQIINHKKILVDNKVCQIPSFNLNNKNIVMFVSKHKPVFLKCLVDWITIIDNKLHISVENIDLSQLKNILDSKKLQTHFNKIKLK